MIKLLNPSLMGEFTHILSTDPALDTEAKDFKDAFKRFQEDGTLPPLKNGLEPTVFTLAKLTDTEKLAEITGVLERVGQEAWAVELACYSLKSISNLKDPNGEDFKLDFETVGGFRKVCKEHRDMMGPQVLKELGLIVLSKQSPS
jgi:hypothetical protein